MSSSISVFIEMPGYLKKYLIFHSKNKEEPLIFPQKHDYNISLTKLVTNNSKIKPPDYHKKGVKIKLPFNEIKDVYFYNKLSTDARQYFRAQIKNDFLYDFRMFLKDKEVSFLDRKKALQMFFLSLNITDDDINYASFYRSFSRYNKKKRATYCESAFTQLNRQFVLS